MDKKLVLSTGDAEKDVKVLAAIEGETLVNKESFEEARERERRANEATAKQPDAEGASRNALTEQPFVEGQVIAVVDEGEKKSASEEYMESLRNKPKNTETRTSFDLKV
jgi:hypothetical protein